MTKPIERQFLSVIEAEVMTGLSRWTWRKFAYSGRISSTKCGTRLVLPIEEINRIMGECTRARLEPVA